MSLYDHQQWSYLGLYSDEVVPALYVHTVSIYIHFSCSGRACFGHRSLSWEDGLDSTQAVFLFPQVVSR